MPWDTFGNWIGGTGGIQQAEQTIIDAMNNYTAQTQNAAAQVHAQHIAAHGQATQQARNQYIGDAFAQRNPLTTDTNNFLEIVEEFAIVCRHGLKEIIVDKRVYNDLLAYFHTYRTYFNNPVEPGATHLMINTSGGALIIRPEGGLNASQIDFDKYMEEIDEHAP